MDTQKTETPDSGTGVKNASGAQGERQSGGGLETASMTAISPTLREAFPDLAQQDWRIVQQIAQRENVAPMMVCQNLLLSVLHGESTPYQIPKHS